MTITASGVISISDINTEFALGYSLSSYQGVTWYTDAGGTGTFPAGAIAMSDFYGKRKTPATITIDYLLVAGGGSGAAYVAGGGGAGGHLSGSATISLGAKVISIGTGGAAVPASTYAGNQGVNTTAFGFTAIGGGRGAGGFPAPTPAPGSGGSGGGMGFVNQPQAAGTPGQGYPGSSGYGGGGGAGGVGTKSSPSGGPGGIGAVWLDGVRRAGGGAGGDVAGGGAGGGGNGQGVPGTVNTGGGGGGTNSNITSGAGGSGIVIIRYAGAASRGSYTGTMSTTITGGYVYHYMTSSGTLTLT